MVLIAAACAGAETDPEQTLARLREIARDEAARIPNYTCVETHRPAIFSPGGRCGSSTTVAQRLRHWRRDACGAGHTATAIMRRLAAASGCAGYHLLAPTNTDRFPAGSASRQGGRNVLLGGRRRLWGPAPAELLEPGPSGTGAIGPMLTNVLADAPQFQFDGEKTVDGRRLYAWSFRIPLERSHNIFIGRGGLEATVAYEGTILAEPEAASPSSSPSSRPIAGRDLLLPVHGGAGL